MSVRLRPDGSRKKAEKSSDFEKLPQDLEIQVKILDAEGTKAVCGSGMDCRMTVPAVHLWDGIQDPYLYQARARLYREGQVVDEISSRFGFRSFSVDPKKGFFLNGRSYPLRGVSRHQDWKGIGNALDRAHHQKDMELMQKSEPIRYVWLTISMISTFMICAMNTEW